MKKSPGITETLLVLVLLACTVEVTEAEEKEGPSLAALKARVEGLEDREAIRELLYRYGRLLDKEDLKGYSRLFAQDGVWEGGIGSAKGPESIYAMLKKVFGKIDRNRYGDSYHIMSDIIIEVEGNTATSWSRWTWIVEGKDGRPVPQRSGHYEDVLVRENGHWRFKHRLTVTELPTEQNDSESHLFRTDWEDGSDSD